MVPGNYLRDKWEKMGSINIEPIPKGEAALKRIWGISVRNEDAEEGLKTEWCGNQGLLENSWKLA
jgi:hypothetical protein